MQVKEDMMYIDFRSDTLTKPSEAMRTVMMDAEVGDDVFGEDPTINALQEKASTLFGKEAGLFVPSGTMGNEIAIKVWTNPGDEIILDTLCHIINFETGAPALLAGVNLISLIGDKGRMDAGQIERAIRPSAIQFAKTGLICIENSHNYAGGSVYSHSSIKEISDLAKNSGVPLHLDGARIFNACCYSGISPAEYGSLIDSLTFCVSKGLGAPVGSVLLGSEDFIDRARSIRKIFGGGMRQAGILAAAGIYALDNNVDRLKSDHANAQKIASILNSTQSFEVFPNEVQTNIVIFRIIGSSLTTEAATKKFKESGILLFPFGENQLRIVTHLDVTDEMVEMACKRILDNF